MCVKVCERMVVCGWGVIGLDIKRYLLKYEAYLVYLMLSAK